MNGENLSELTFDDELPELKFDETIPEKNQDQLRRERLEKNFLGKVAYGITDYTLPQILTEAKFKRGQRNIYGDIFERPAAAIRSALLGRGYIQGAEVPEEVPNFQDIALEKYYQSGKPSALKTAEGFGVSALGMGADIVTNPAQLLMMLSGEQISKKEIEELEKVKDVTGITIQNVIESPIGQAVQKGVERLITKTPKTKLPLKQITKEIKLYQEQYAFGLPKEETTRKIGEQISEKGKELSRFKNNFDQIINTETKTNAVNIKPKLREFNNNLSKSYDKGIDEIDSLINLQNKTVNIGDVGIDWIENSLNKISNDPEAVIRISNAAQKQGFIVNEVLDDFGDKVYRVYHPEKMNDTVSFRELINFKNMFKKINLSSTAKSGIGFQKQDMAYRALQDSWGEFILKNYKLTSNEPTEIAEMFTQLQKEYAPLAQAKWKAFKIFKPYDIEAIDVQKGMKFFKDYVLNKNINELEGGTAKLLNILEKGSDFSPGIGGNISSRLKSLGDIKIKSEKDLTNFINNLLKQKVKVTDLLSQEKELVQKRERLLNLLGWGAKITGGGLLFEGGRRIFKSMEE